MFNKKIELIIENKYPPNIPAYVLFGLILINFGPLNNLPNLYKRGK